MSVTANEIFMITLALSGDLDENGIADDVGDLQVRTPGILTALQAEHLRTGDIYSTFEIANKPVTNMLGFSSGHDYVEFLGNDLTIEASGNVKAYYFEVSDDAVVYIEDFTSGWNILATVNCVPVNGGYTAYKAKVTPTVGATKSRIRFSGANRYVFTNYALFSAPFATNADVPDYRPWVAKQMPADFKSVDQITEEYPQRQYAKSANFKWEGRNKLYINYFYEGNIRIVYRPVPLTITAMTDVLQVDDVTARSVLPWGLAMEFYKDDDVKFAYFQSRYREMKALAMTKQPASEGQILNLYGVI
jgi:hypothetical protein